MNMTQRKYLTKKISRAYDDASGRLHEAGQKAQRAAYEEVLKKTITPATLKAMGVTNATDRKRVISQETNTNTSGRRGWYGLRGEAYDYLKYAGYNDKVLEKLNEAFRNVVRARNEAYHTYQYGGSKRAELEQARDAATDAAMLGDSFEEANAIMQQFTKTAEGLMA